MSIPRVAPLSPLALVPALGLVLVSACASSGASSAAASDAGSQTRTATQTVRIQGVGSLTMNSTPTSASTKSVPFSVDQVWAALPAVYDSLGIPITLHDVASRTIANEGLKVRQRLGKVSLSRYLDCGNTQMGPSADSYDVFLTVATQLRAGDGGSTVVTTALEATAKSIQFSQAASQCTSKGELEPRVHAMLVALLAAQPHR